MKSRYLLVGLLLIGVGLIAAIQTKSLDPVIARFTGTHTINKDMQVLMRGTEAHRERMEQNIAEFKQAVPIPVAKPPAACVPQCTSCLSTGKDNVCGEWPETLSDAEVRQALCAKPIWAELKIDLETCMRGPKPELQHMGCTPCP